MSWLKRVMLAPESKPLVASEGDEAEIQWPEIAAADLRTMLDSMGEGLIAINAEGVIDLLNPVASSLLSRPREELLGLSWREALTQPQLAEVVQEALEGRATASTDSSLVSQEGERLVDARAIPRFDADGKASGALLVMRDVTLARMADAMRRDLLVNVSHELKTPIAALRGMVETMVDDPSMDAPIRERFMQRMEKQCHRLSTLVNDVLALGRIEASEEAPPREEVDLLELVAAVIGELGMAAEKAAVTVIFEPTEASHMVLGDAELLRQALSNLVINAVTYSDPDATVVVRILSRPGGHLIEVEDTGIGISEEHLSRIFERFYRADPARSRERGGSGLGLSIVKHVAIVHGGDVSVASTPGVGSTFRLRIPSRDADEQLVG